LRKSSIELFHREKDTGKDIGIARPDGDLGGAWDDADVTATAQTRFKARTMHQINMPLPFGR
jgi:hypothetical protein